MTRTDRVAVALFAVVMVALLIWATFDTVQPAGLGWCPRRCGVWG